MLIFVTSLRSRSLAHDWDHHLRLLDRMVASCLAQTNPDIRVVIVCHDVPDLPQVADFRVHVIAVDFPPPRRDFWDMTMDKVRKVTLGAQWAIRQGADFVMYADADDLVSRRLCAFVEDHQHANGWYLEHGYAYSYGQYSLKQRKQHHLKCGTSAIVRADLLRFEPSDEYGGMVVEEFAAVGHQDYCRFMERSGHPLEPLPFAGSVYIEHADSTSTVQEAGQVSSPWSWPVWRRRLSRARRAVQQAPELRLLTPALAREFTISRKRLL